MLDINSVTNITGSGVGLVIFEEIVRSSEPSSAKKPRPSSEKVYNTEKDDETNIWRGNGDGRWRERDNLDALTKLLAVKNDMDGFLSISI